MDFSAPKKRQAGEPILPMINVVFLLLIFFLLSSQIAPRAPFAVTPPTLDSGAPSAPEAVLFLSADGQMHFSGAKAREDDALTAIAAQAEAFETLTLRADADAPAHEVAALIAKLRDAGVKAVKLTGSGS